MNMKSANNRLSKTPDLDLTLWAACKLILSWPDPDENKNETASTPVMGETVSPLSADCLSPDEQS